MKRMVTRRQSNVSPGNVSAGELRLASDVVHLSWGAGQWSLFVFLITTPRGPWLGAPVRTLALSKTALSSD
jgi:hypothetical protein